MRSDSNPDIMFRSIHAQIAYTHKLPRIGNMTLENYWTKHTKMYSLKATAGGTLFGPPRQPTGCKDPRWNLTTVSFWWMKSQGMAFNITITSTYTSTNHLCCWNTWKGRHFRDVKVFMTHPVAQCKDLLWAKFSKLPSELLYLSMLYF